MKYPSHIILDTQNRNLQPVSTRWEVNFCRPKTYIFDNIQVLENLTTLKPTLINRTSGAEFPAVDFRSQVNTQLPIFDIHFIRKEKLYTKLKYSRCPQYDIVSGGFAALLAGFIGFLISEKFGIELVDGGDFYNALMYVIFITFSLRSLVRVYSRDRTPYSPISLKYLVNFTCDLIVLLAKQIQVFMNKITTLYNNIKS